MNTGRHYMRAPTIAKLLDVSERTVRRWIAGGTLPSAKAGGARLVAREDLERLLDRPDPFGQEENNDEE